MSGRKLGTQSSSRRRPSYLGDKTTREFKDVTKFGGTSEDGMTQLIPGALLFLPSPWQVRLNERPCWDYSRDAALVVMGADSDEKPDAPGQSVSFVGLAHHEDLPLSAG